MKTIIAEKPSVAREIARIVGASQKETGYLIGNGYQVTWAFGHLVTPALPESYGVKGFHKDNLPIIPTVFTLIPRQVKTKNGYSPDNDVVAQIKIIEQLFRNSDRIIVATDAGREGELIFRYLYEYLGCATPFDRLWINSLTDKSIREGLSNLKSGNCYDHLYSAAKARSEADWLVGINATQAITIAAGRGTYSLGRVQTPTLAMICSRYRENKQFISEAFWQLHLSTGNPKEEMLWKFTSVEKWDNKQSAEKLYQTIKNSHSFIVKNVECNETIQEPPLLYDLTTIQKDANIKHGFSADKTLSIAQKLYETKLITYPRTGCRFIPEDVFAEIPSLLLSLTENTKWGASARKIVSPSRRSVDDKKITDHHALLITEVKPQNLSFDEASIYNMIIARMLEAFSEKCIKDINHIIADCSGVSFTIKGSVVKQKGWRSICNEDLEEIILPKWTTGEILNVKGCSITEGQTKPKPLHTEASLLAAMETAGKDILDEELKLSLSGCGIGTPATRASIIETLFQREYIVRQKKSLIPTEKGLALYSIVKDMHIANVEMTGEWEHALSNIENGKLHADSFRNEIEQYTTKITTELLTCEKLFTHKETQCQCPKCKVGTMQFFSKVLRCDNPDCQFPVFRQIAGKSLTDKELLELTVHGKTGLIKGFSSKQGKPFNAYLIFDEDLHPKFVFPDLKAKDKSNQKK